MRKVIFVSNTPVGMRHRAFSVKNASFCGRSPQPDVTQWAYRHETANNREALNCRQCEKSELNREGEDAD